MRFCLIENEHSQYWTGYPLSKWDDDIRAAFRYRSKEVAEKIIKSKKLRPCYIKEFEAVLSNDFYYGKENK